MFARRAYIAFTLGLLDMFSVITSPNRNLCGWNLENKWRGTVHTHTRKLGEIAAGAPPQGAKTCFVFLLWIQCGLSATYPALISIFLKQQTWIAFRMRTPVKIFRISAHGFLHVPKQLKIRCSRARRLCPSTAQTVQLWAIGIISGASQRPKDVPFVREFWWATYGSGAINPPKTPILAIAAIGYTAYGVTPKILGLVSLVTHLHASTSLARASTHSSSLYCCESPDTLQPV